MRVRAISSPSPKSAFWPHDAPRDRPGREPAADLSRRSSGAYPPLLRRPQDRAQRPAFPHRGGRRALYRYRRARPGRRRPRHRYLPLPPRLPEIPASDGHLSGLAPALWRRQPPRAARRRRDLASDRRVLRGPDLRLPMGGPARPGGGRAEARGQPRPRARPLPRAERQVLRLHLAALHGGPRFCPSFRLSLAVPKDRRIAVPRPWGGDGRLAGGADARPQSLFDRGPRGLSGFRLELLAPPDAQRLAQARRRRRGVHRPARALVRPYLEIRSRA